MKNAIPKLSEVSPGVLEFGIDRRPANVGRRFTIYFLVIGFAALVCGPGIVLAYGDWYGFSLFAGFYFVFSALTFALLFSSSSFLIHAKDRTLTRRRFLWNWHWQTVTWMLNDKDQLTAYVSPNEAGTGADHLIYLTINGADHYLCNVRLPMTVASQDLLDWMDAISKPLRICKPGYGSTMTYVKRRLMPRL